VAPAPVAAAAPPPPNAPKRTFVSGRFMAWPIMRVSSVPDAPTSVPETISRSLCSTKPDAAAAMPVHELSSEITTGMSAPPIGSTKSTPSSSASAPAATRRVWPSLKLMLAARITTAAATSAFTGFCAG
jgi:hypothetical protein